MFVAFDIDKCLEAAGVLFSTTDEKMMGRMRLLKLLYLANRKSLAETGDPIVDDDAVAMKHGPVLSHTYDLIKGKAVNDAVGEKEIAVWDDHFKVADRIQIRMLRDPGADHLSDYDVKTLVEIAREYQDAEDDDLSDLTHEFDEYKRHWDGRHYAEPIPDRDLLTAIGCTPEQVDAILKDGQIYSWEQDALGCR